MDEQDSRQRRRGPISHGIDIVNAGRTVGQGVRLARTAGAAAGVIGANIWIVVGIIVGITLVTFILTLSGGSAAGIPEDGEDQTSTAPPGGEDNPIVISGTGEACVTPFAGTGYCSVDYLLKYFGGNRSKAIVASLICQSESGSFPLSLNDTCSTNDYSIGLFQINAVAHCAGAYANLSCNNLLSSARRSACLAGWWDPEQNIQQALSISSGGSSWVNWGTWLSAGKTRFGVKDILTQCNVSL
ncbi:MAG: hypothetical protein HYU48_02745 [Candidatus Levybacteria bacterium]|nr:hypothetical protein [Candidatus Levybacteria bacterium]